MSVRIQVARECVLGNPRKGRPYLASSQARSMWTILGQMCIVAPWRGPGPRACLNSGRASSAKLILSEVPSECQARNGAEEVLAQL